MKLYSTFGYGSKANIDEYPQLNSETFLHIFDVFSADWLDELFDKKGYPGVLLSDHLTSCEPIQNVDFYGLPLWLNRERKQWKISDFESISNLNTEYCFNFMINKQQLTRYLLIKLVEIFNLSSYDYTWSGIGKNFDLSFVLTEFKSLITNNPFNEEQISQLLSPIQIAKKFIDCPNGPLDINYQRIRYGGNKWAWDNAIQCMFSNSAIALISETSFTFPHDKKSLKASVFTEKTLYSVLGLNFPLWIGGYAEAAEWQRLGFDTFDDIIDHSYQYYDTVAERCYWAFAKNLDLLNNLNRVATLRQENLSRLLDNRKKILSDHLDCVIDNEIDKMPEDIRMHTKTILEKFQTSETNMTNYKP